MSLCELGLRAVADLGLRRRPVGLGRGLAQMLPPSACTPLRGPSAAPRAPTHTSEPP